MTGWGMCKECGVVYILGREDLERNRPCRQCEGSIIEVSRFVGRTVGRSGLFNLTELEREEQRERERAETAGCALCSSLIDLAERQQRQRRRSARLWDRARQVIETYQTQKTKERMDYDPA